MSTWKWAPASISSSTPSSLIGPREKTRCFWVFFFFSFFFVGIYLKQTDVRVCKESVEQSGDVTVEPLWPCWPAWRALLSSSCLQLCMGRNKQFRFIPGTSILGDERKKKKRANGWNDPSWRDVGWQIKNKMLKVERNVQLSKNKSEQARSIIGKKKKKNSISTFHETFLQLILLRFLQLGGEKYFESCSLKETASLSEPKPKPAEMLTHWPAAIRH